LDTPREILGFNALTYGPFPTVPTSVLAPNVAQFNQVNYFLLHSDLTNKGIRFNNNYNQTISQILIDVPPGSQITYKPFNPAKISAPELAGTNRTNLRFWLTDDRNRRVNTNGEYFTARIVIHYLKPYMLAEDTGAMKKGSFGGDLENINPDDKVLLMSKKAGLEQEGYGLPAQALKMKLVRQMRKKKQKGGRISMSKSYGTSKGHKLKGGFFQFLAPLLGTVARSVGTSLLGGILGKVFGGDGIISDLSGKASKIMKGKAVKMIGNIISNITHSDLPNHIVEKAGQALELIHQMSDDNKTKKDKILTVGKFLIPHVKNIIASKMNGEGLTPAGGAMMKTNDKKIIEIIRKDLNKIY
jgi:hypothetical protein